MHVIGSKSRCPSGTSKWSTGFVMLLPFFVGQYSVTSILLDVFIPAFSSQSDWGTADENGFQFNGSFLQTVTVFFRNSHLGEKRSCLYGIPCISLILVIFAITAWRFVRQRRTSELLRSHGQRTVDRHVNRVCCIAGGWLTHPSYRWMSRCLCALTVLHWFTREWFLYISYHQWRPIWRMRWQLSQFRRCLVRLFFFSFWAQWELICLCEFAAVVENERFLIQ